MSVRMKGNHQCRLCGRWLEGEWNRSKSEAERAELARQMEQGHCDGCGQPPDYAQARAELDAALLDLDRLQELTRADPFERRTRTAHATDRYLAASDKFTRAVMDGLLDARAGLRQRQEETT